MSLEGLRILWRPRELTAQQPESHGTENREQTGDQKHTTGVFSPFLDQNLVGRDTEHGSEDPSYAGQRDVDAHVLGGSFRCREIVVPEIPG